jgi:8-oxo-dGTP diphosphatase
MTEHDGPTVVVVAGALIVDGALLIAQRARPPELAGLWELPGGKVAPGESDADALARELHEELGVDVVVGGRIGADVALSDTMTLRAYLVTRTGGPVEARDHRAIRWITVADLDDVAWVPADRAWLVPLTIALRAAQA